MNAIDYTPWRDFFRTVLTGGVAPIINPDIFVNEGESYSGDKPMWVEEVVGIDGEEHLTNITNPGLQLTITYNVYADKQMRNTADVSEKLRQAIATACRKNFDPIGAITIYDITPRRRIATSQEGVRLSPIDISFKLCNKQTRSIS
jgi:hypothetical protein